MSPNCPYCGDMGCFSCSNPSPMTLDDLEEIEAQMELVVDSDVKAPVFCKWPDCPKGHQSPPRGQCDCSVKWY